MSIASNTKRTTSRPTRLLGNLGEELVARYLEKDGFAILARNYSVRGGEIDIIATKKELIVFVEVKTRTSQLFALSEVITYSKQKKIIFTAQHFLARHESLDKIYRFDVALVEGIDSDITYLPNAFTQSDW